MRALFTHTLRRQLILVIALVHAALMTLFVLDFTAREHGRLLEGQAQHTEALAKTIATSSAGWVAARDLYGLQEIVDAQAGFPELRYAMILDAKGKVLAHTDRARVGQYVQDMPFPPALRRVEETARLVDVIAPIYAGDIHIGWVGVALGQEAARTAQKAIVRSGVAYAGIAILIGALVAWLIGTRLTRRLVAIQQVADTVGAGDTTPRVTIRGRDEVARLATDFNIMLDNLVASRAELAKGEERWIRALESAGLGVWDWNVSTNEVYFSHRWKSMLGWADAEISNDFSEWSARVHPEDIDQCHVALYRHFSGEVPAYQIEFRMRRKDGSWCWVFAQGTVFERDPFGKPLRIVGTHTDISMQKEAEAALRASEARAHQIIENAPEAMLVSDQTGRLLRVNSRASQMFGYAPEELVDQPVEILIPEAVRNRHRSDRDGYMREPAHRPMGASRDLLARRKDGSLFPVVVSLAPMPADDGLQVIASVSDISERLALERELVAHRDQLEERVAIRTVELEHARAHAERLARVKSEFLANMSHEIRTPLNAVLGYARIGLRNQPDAPAKENYGRILNAGEHLLGVINDVLDLSKIEAGKFEVARRPFQLAAVIANAGSFVAGAAHAKRLAYVVESEPGLPQWVEGDAQRLQQILVNLLSNAVKYTDGGSVRLSVSRKGSHDVCFAVSDTGIGLDAALAARVFQPFEQGDNSTARRYGGTGLGLSISQHLAHLMGGAIDLDSTPGMGSCFTLYLPLEQVEAPGGGNQSAHTGEQRLAGLRVLAAEDVEVNRVILEDALHHEGARVVFAVHGAEALERLQEAGPDAFDLVLMDVQMPVMDGYEATRRLANLAPGLPVIGLTAHAMPEEQARCREAGMLELVVKPLDPDALVAAIHRVVSGVLVPPVAHDAPLVVPVEQPAVTVALVDWPALLKRCNGRTSTRDKLVASVRSTYARTPAKLREAARAGDMETLAFEAHAIKGMSGNLEARALYTQARETEEVAQVGGEQAVQQAGELARELASLVERLLEELAGEMS